MPPLNITVSGESKIYQRAERAVIFLAVKSDGLSQASVSKDVTETANELKGRLVKLSEGTAEATAITHWTMTAMSTSSYQPHGDEKGHEPPRRFTATVRFEVKFRNFNALSSLITTFSTTAHVSVQSLSWRLTAITTAALATRSRKEAVRDAVAKARDYAQAAGRQQPVLVDIADAAVVGGSGGYGGMMRMMAPMGGGGDDEGLSLEPEDVEVSSSVQVKFVAEY